MRRSVKFLLGFLSFATVFSIIFFPAYFVPKNKTTTTTMSPITEPEGSGGSGEGSGFSDLFEEDSALFIPPSYRSLRAYGLFEMHF